MSINEIMNYEFTLPLLLVALLVWVLGMFIFLRTLAAKSQASVDNAYGNNEVGTVIEVPNAKIVSKRVDPLSENQTIMIKKIVFETLDGNRIALAIQDTVCFDAMVEGDIGTLRYHGRKFISFDRDTPSNENTTI